MTTCYIKMYYSKLLNYIENDGSSLLVALSAYVSPLNSTKHILSI